MEGGKKLFIGFTPIWNVKGENMRINPILPSYKVNYLTKTNSSKQNINNINIQNRNFEIYFGRDLVKPAQADTSYFHLPQGCTPDEFQKEAGRAISAGKDVIVEAPTGTGKTAVAYYAASKNMKEGKKTFYTTPLKALSNQKLKEFKEIYGEENVGILTGDRRENADAPILIMTTEVYRNMALSKRFGEEAPLMDNLGTVIFDECHYMGDISRGAVWEESIMLTPKDTQVLALSATIGNPDEVQSWMNTVSENGVHLVSIPAEARNVPLIFDRLTTLNYEKEEKMLGRSINRGYVNAQSPAVYAKPSLSDFNNAVKELKNKNQLPAIFFIFSRKFSRELLEYLEKEAPVLTSEAEQKEIDEIVKKYASQKYIGSELNVNALKHGYAIHNAGIIPAQKELVEELFQKKLIKAVISTETLAAGINMPAKTVVISSSHKPVSEIEDESGNRLLTSNEFKQMAGRAGRRGIDKVGYVYTMPVNMQDEQEFLSLEALAHNSLESRYNPDYPFLTGYYHYNPDENALTDIYSQTFYVHSKDKNEREQKLNELKDISSKKTEVLESLGYIKRGENGIEVTSKGEISSKVRGYNALILTDLITSGALDNITPETLALLAGAISTPANPKEDELTPQTDITGIFDKASETAQVIERELKSQLNAGLAQFGKDLKSFSSYEEILEFINGLEKTDRSKDEIKSELEYLQAIRSKVYKISSDTGRYSPQSLMSAMQNGETIPSSVLQNYLNTVNSYKKKVNGDIQTYIEKLKSQISETQGNEKGKKAKAKLDRQREELEKELEYAQIMKYFDENIENALYSNSRFKKEYPLERIKRECARSEQEYARATAQEKIAQPVKGLISLRDKKSDFKSECNADRVQTNGIVNKLAKITEKVRATETEKGIKSLQCHYNKTSGEILYLWAYLNKTANAGIVNWIKTIKSAGEKADEGTIYRMILQSADLISQIKDMARAGIEYSRTEEEAQRYKNLEKTALEAGRLIIQDPVSL